MKKQEMVICLWFDNQAEEAARFYTSVFHDSAIGNINRFGTEGFEYHHKPEGTVMTVDFRLNDMKFTALNGGPQFKFNEAISITVNCMTQNEIDYYWSKLTEGGMESQCGWLKDKFGVSWQIVPANMNELVSEKDPEAKSRVEKAMFPMKKLDIKTLMHAHKGKVMV